MSSEQTSVPRTAAQQVAAADWKRIGRELAEGLADVGKALEELGKRHKEAREAAALFALHRQYRFRPEGAPPRDETLAMIHAALDGYDPEYLEQLAMFGGFLADAAGKRYAAR